jgi:hypothetical protein
VAGIKDTVEGIAGSGEAIADGDFEGIIEDGQE